MGFYGYEEQLFDHDTGENVPNPQSVERFLQEIWKDKIVDDIRSYRQGLVAIDMADMDAGIVPQLDAGGIVPLESP